MAIFVGIILLFFQYANTTFSDNQEETEAYQRIMSEAHHELECGNYDISTQLYIQAADTANNKESRLEAEYWTGASYFIKALNLDDTISYHSALKEYRAIIKGYDESDSDFYIDAVADSCCIYYYLGYSYADINWVDLIGWLEDKYDSGTIEGINSLNITLAAKVTMTLALYYDKAAEETMNPGEDNIYLEKAVTAYNSTFRLLGMQNEYSGINTFDSREMMFFLEQFCNKALNYYLNSRKGTVLDIENVIMLCENALTSVAHRQVTSDYINLNTIIGKSHWLLAALSDTSSDVDSQLEHNKISYRTLMPLVKLQLDSEYTDTLQFNAGLYAMASTLCTEDDIADILALFDKGLNKYDPSTRLIERVDLLTTACTFCEFYLNYYPEIPQIRVFAEETIEELESMWLSYLTDFDKDRIHNLRLLLD